MKIATSISSILSNEFLGNLIDERYDYNSESNCEILRIGINHTYLVINDNGKFVLRVYTKDWKSEKEILGEIEFLLLLKNNEVSVSYPISDKDEKYIQVINAVEGKRFAVLFSFSHGQTIRNPSEKICYGIGREMAKMHEVSIDKRIEREDYILESMLLRAYESLKTKISEESEQLKYVDRSMKIIAKKVNEVNSDQLRKGAIHLDIWSDNLKVNNNNQVELFDFDNCGNGYLFMDIAYTVFLLYKGESNELDFKNKLKSFYNGYESVSMINDEEKHLIPYGALGIWLYYSGIHAERFNDFSNLFFNEDFLKAWIGIVDKWMKFNRIEV